jgi:hypothetical protein
MELAEHADLYLAKRKAYDEAKKRADDLEKAWRQVEADMINAMLAKKEKFFKLVGTGMSFGLAERFSISVTEKNKDQVRAWLVETTGDDAPFLVEVPDKPSVQAHVKKLVEANRQAGDRDSEGLPEFLNIKTSPKLSCRGR